MKVNKDNADQLLSKAIEYLGIIRINPHASLNHEFAIPYATATALIACAIYLKILVEPVLVEKPVVEKPGISEETLDEFRAVLKMARELVEEMDHDLGGLEPSDFFFAANEIATAYDISFGAAINLVISIYRMTTEEELDEK